MADCGVDLGFAEECEPWLLTNRYFPSKIGGKPAWLELQNLPKPADLLCSICQNPLVFLCQVYAPIESNPECFHRTIYLFICKTKDCFKANSCQNIIALRSQLKRDNPYYSCIAPNEDEELPAIAPLSKLCNVCGCLGPLTCSGCKSVYYCGKSHQHVDWKSGHKSICKGSAVQDSTKPSVILFPEFEIAIEAAPETLTAPHQEDSDEANKKRLEEYENLVKEGKAGQLSKLPDSDLAQFVTNCDDKFFGKFKKCIQSNPEQVLRYHRGGTPLWITEPVQSEQLVPCCELCGSNRIFEFQVMPQLLNYLKNDDIDWGTINVYSCSESCDPKAEYVKEIVVKQDITDEKHSEK